MKNAKFYSRKINVYCWKDNRHKSDGLMVFLDGSEISVCKVCFLKNVKRIGNSSENKEKAKVFKEYTRKSSKNTNKMEGSYERSYP